MSLVTCQQDTLQLFKDKVTADPRKVASYATTMTFVFDGPLISVPDSEPQVFLAARELIGERSIIVAILKDGKPSQ